MNNEIPAEQDSVNHDRNFKELISHFFTEFIDLFFPDISAYLDPDFAMVALDKEIFTDIGDGDVHEVDLLMKAKFKGSNAFFLIHVENQATAQADFPRRMFGYFARPTLKYKLPVYPIVIFSYDAPHRPEPKEYTVTFPGWSVLQFHYRVVQLNRLSWRKFLKSNNPVASALIAKMKMRSEDRPKVRAVCLRMMASFRLDPAKSKLLGGFLDSYLRLTAAEMVQFERVVGKFTPVERENAMGLVSSWEQRGIDRGIEQGIEQGITRGKEELILRQLRRRLGAVPLDVATHLEPLTSAQLDELGDALFDFTSVADLEQWLAQNPS